MYSNNPDKSAAEGKRTWIAPEFIVISKDPIKSGTYFLSSESQFPNDHVTIFGGTVS